VRLTVHGTAASAGVWPRGADSEISAALLAVCSRGDINCIQYLTFINRTGQFICSISVPIHFHHNCKGRRPPSAKSGIEKLPGWEFYGGVIMFGGEISGSPRSRLQIKYRAHIDARATLNYAAKRDGEKLMIIYEILVARNRKLPLLFLY